MKADGSRKNEDKGDTEGKERKKKKKKTLMSGKEEQPKSLIYKYKNLYTKKTDFTRKKKEPKKTQKRTKKNQKKPEKKRVDVRK